MLKIILNFIVIFNLKGGLFYAKEYYRLLSISEAGYRCEYNEDSNDCSNS
jgi:hypothetical protein